MAKVGKFTDLMKFALFDKLKMTFWQQNPVGAH